MSKEAEEEDGQLEINNTEWAWIFYMHKGLFSPYFKKFQKLISKCHTQSHKRGVSQRNENYQSRGSGESDFKTFLALCATVTEVNCTN